MQDKMRSTTAIDYTIRERRLIREAFEALAHKTDIRVIDLDDKIEQLLARGSQVKPVLLSLLHSTDEAILVLLTLALESMDDPTIVEPLLQALRDPTVPEIAKLYLLPVLEYYDVDLEDPRLMAALSEAFDNLDYILERSTTHMLETLNEDDESLNFVLESFQELPSEVRLAFVRQFGETQDERAVRLLSLLVRTDDIDSACEAARYLGRIRSPRAARALKLLLTEPHPSEVTTQIKRSLQRLRLMSIAPSCEGNEHPLPASVYMVNSSYIDSAGYRVLWIAWNVSGDDSVLSAISLMLHSETGIQDCFGTARMDKQEFHELMQAMFEEAGGFPIEYEYALVLIRDALWCNHTCHQSIPPEFALWKDLFAGQELSPQRYEPDWEEMGLDVPTLQADDELLEKSYELHNYDEFAGWFDQSAATYDYCAEMLALLERHQGQILEELIDLLLERYAMGVFEAKVSLIRRNLELVADMLIRAGKSHELAQMALVAALQLNNGQVALHHHPFIERMMEESLDFAEVNILHGFNGQLDLEE